jgi:hypothetical protein
MCFMKKSWGEKSRGTVPLRLRRKKSFTTKVETRPFNPKNRWTNQNNANQDLASWFFLGGGGIDPQIFLLFGSHKIISKLQYTLFSLRCDHCQFLFWGCCQHLLLDLWRVVAYTVKKANWNSLNIHWCVRVKVTFPLNLSKDYFHSNTSMDIYWITACFFNSVRMKRCASLGNPISKAQAYCLLLLFRLFSDFIV